MVLFIFPRGGSCFPIPRGFTKLSVTENNLVDPPDYLSDGICFPVDPESHIARYLTYVASFLTLLSLY